MITNKRMKFLEIIFAYIGCLISQQETVLKMMNKLFQYEITQEIEQSIPFWVV